MKRLIWLFLRVTASPRLRVCLIAHCALLTLTASAQAADNTAPGAVQLSATFQSISVRAPFSGDANANNQAQIQFRKPGEATWHDAYSPMIDRRATVEGAANPYASEARGSIVGLIADTDYEVKVLWNDAEGVTSQPAVSTIRTLSFNPPTGGSVIAVTNNATLTSALGSVTAGQTIHLNPGTYSPFTISRSGTANAWIVLEGDPGGGTIITGAGVTQNILVAANYLILKNFTLGPSDWSGIVVNGNHVFVQDNTLQDISRLCANDPNGHYNDSGIAVRGPNIYVLRNTVQTTSLNNTACTLVPAYASPADGIDHGNQPNTVIMNNSVTGGFRDGIGSGGAGQGIENVDIQGNVVQAVKDDAIELDGDDVNVRIGSNQLIVNNGLSAISNTPTRFGPSYLFRNVIRVTPNWGTQIFKLSSDGTFPTFIFHNSLENLAPYAWDNIIGVRGMVLNNIFKNRGLMYFNVFNTTQADYNNYWRIGGSYYASSWGTASYDTFAEFRAGTGQETHGKEADPAYSDTQLHIPTNSPAANSGVIIPNFNDAASAWPFAGAAPEMGAYELAAGSPPAGSDYYVDFARTSSGDGTAANPWKYRSDINWTAIASALQNGPVTLYFSSRGTWTDDQYLRVPAHTNVGPNRLTLDGQSQYNTVASGTAQWQVESITTHRATITNTGSNGSGGTVYIENDNAFLTIRGFNLPHPTWGGIALGEANPTLNIHDVLVENNVIDTPTNLQGVWFGYAETGCYNITVRGNTISNSPLEGIYMGHYNYLANTITGTVIENNTVINSGTQGEGDIDIKGGNFGAIVRYNTVFSGATGGVLAGIVVAASDVQVYGNTLYNLRPHDVGDGGNGIEIGADGDGQGNGTTVNNLLIYNNLIYGNAQRGISMYATAAGAKITNAKFLNNTIVSNGGTGFLTSSVGHLITISAFENNIIASNSPYAMSISQGTQFTALDYNLYDGTGPLFHVQDYDKTWAEWRALGYDAHGITANPLLDAAYKPTAGSPALNAAATLTEFAIDMSGTPRPQGSAWDIGAYESSSGQGFSACDLNSDGWTNVTDVQQVVNQAIGAAACTADINQDGQCNVVDVQRVVNAALGAQCVSP